MQKQSTISILHALIKSNCDITSIREMITSHEVDVNYVDEDGNSVLHHAVNYHRLDVIQLLLPYVADNINLKNNCGDTVRLCCINRTLGPN